MIRLRKIILLVLLAFLVCRLIWGCSPTKDTARNDRRVSAWMMANPGRAGLKCFQLFRSTDSTGTTLEYRPGTTILSPSDSAVFDPYSIYDPWLKYTRQQLGDSLSKALLQVLMDSFRKHPIKAPCPPTRHTRDTIYKDNYTRIRDRAFEAALVDSAGRLTKRLEQANARARAIASWRSFWMWAFIIAAGYTLLRIIIKAQWPALGKRLP